MRNPIHRELRQLTALIRRYEGKRNLGEGDKEALEVLRELVRVTRAMSSLYLLDANIDGVHEQARVGTDDSVSWTIGPRNA